MKKTFLTAAAIITVILVVVFSGSGLQPTAHAQSNGGEWQLTVTGLVEHPLTLSLTELTAMPQTTVNAALICVGSQGSVVAEGNWVGVNLWLLLETAGVSPNAVKVAFYASDGYSTDLPLETAERGDVILAYEKDGAPLSETLRLVVPGKWGYKWISQVASIELVNYDFKGFWESNGYSDAADIAEGNVPEFPSVLAILAPFILVTSFVLILKKRVKTPQTRQSLLAA
jgi:DMSO/TMAO reductase YedYZ molybdopterin-dependent catalytic subunit